MGIRKKKVPVGTKHVLYIVIIINMDKICNKKLKVKRKQKKKGNGEVLKC